MGAPIERPEVSSSSKLVCFLYLLMRDEITPGAVEELFRKMDENATEFHFSNGWLARYAGEIAARLELPR